MSWLDDLTFNADGLIPAIAQDHATGQILMMAWQNAESLRLTVETGTAVYFSRSRGKIWHKGESSGHTQIVHEIRTDCDRDVIVLIITHIKDPSEIYGDAVKVDAPHTLIKPDNSKVIGELDRILDERKTADKDSSYVSSLYHKGLNKILEKVGEETTEAIISAKELQLVRATGDNDEHAKADVVYEVADMWFHSLVALHQLGLSGDDVLTELGRRFGLSGIDEKNARTPKG